MTTNRYSLSRCRPIRSDRDVSGSLVSLDRSAGGKGQPARRVRAVLTLGPPGIGGDGVGSHASETAASSRSPHRGLRPLDSGAARLRLHTRVVELGPVGSSRARSPTPTARTAAMTWLDRRIARARRQLVAIESARNGRAVDRTGGRLAPGNDTEVPVVFPGYVLPDDSLEDSTHEGS